MILKTLIHEKFKKIIANNFISSIDNNEERVIYSKSDNIEIMTNDEADEVLKIFFILLKINIKIIWNQ